MLTQSETEFNKLIVPSQIRQKPVSIDRLLKSWKIEYNLRWNQLYLSRGLNLSPGLNSLNSESGC